MVQLRCPVCGQEYTEGAEFCSRCFWNLTPYPASLGTIPSEIQRREQQTLLWAKKLWEKWSHAYSELNKQNQLLHQKLEASKKENQPSLNNSLIEQYLQNISTNVEYLPNMLTILQKINENLVSQSPAIISVTETESKNKVNEPDLSNEPDNLNDNDEVLNLVKNYNQQANFLDKIEVSETEDSKAQRWGGGRKPAIFETNLTNRGEYWIINNQYLVPKPKQKINEYNYKTLSAFFECDNYEENAADNMTLVKPAQVSLIDGEEKWQLETTGSLKF